MKAAGYGLGIIASVAVHALALTLLALAWRADFQRRELSAGNIPIPVWLVADKNQNPAVEAIAPSPGQPSPPVTPERPAPKIGTQPPLRHTPAPVRESPSESVTEPAARHLTAAPPIPPATGAAEPPAQGAETPPSEGDANARAGTTEVPPAASQAAPEPVSASAGNITVAPLEREYRPLFRPEPAYPPRALARGIEGYVVLEFTVTAAGTTRDARVLEANPINIFDAAALAAAREFRYQPRIQAGAPVDVLGVRSRIRFQIRPR